MASAHKNFVAPFIDDNADEWQAAEPMDVGRLLGRTMPQAERRDPLDEARAFMLKYAGLSVVLVVLAVGLTIRLELHYSVGIIVFAGLSTAAYWLLSYTESLFSTPGIERHRLTVGGKVLMRQIEADERVRLAQIRLQRAQLRAQGRMLPAEGTQTPGGPQALTDNFVAPYTPQDIAEAVAYAESLYGPDGYLDSRKVHANGKIRVAVIGSQSQGGSQDARQYLIDRRFLVQREGGYWVARNRYPTALDLHKLRVRGGTYLPTHLPNG